MAAKGKNYLRINNQILGVKVLMSIGGFHCHAVEISIQKYRMPDAKRVSCREILICNLSKFQECRVFRC